MKSIKKFNPLRELSIAEWCLWGFSSFAVTVSFLVPDDKNILSFIASLIGAAALIFVSKGFVLGQVLTVLFSVFYGIVSFELRYYGEMITYLLMSAPSAIAAVISWIRHPYKGSNVVEVSKLSKKSKLFLIITAPIVTAVFYFILKALGNANLFFSTISVTTSYIASYLAFFRSSYYAIGYSANDIVLIILWVLATVKDRSYLPMVLCFVAFLFNDIYGFYNWERIRRKQGKKINHLLY